MSQGIAPGWQSVQALGQSPALLWAPAGPALLTQLGQQHSHGKCHQCCIALKTATPAPAGNFETFIVSEHKESNPASDL